MSRPSIPDREHVAMHAEAVAVIVYRLTGVAILREGWINLDWLWSAALIASGLILILWQ